jgi:hypothetical protein
MVLTVADELALPWRWMLSVVPFVSATIPPKDSPIQPVLPSTMATVPMPRSIVGSRLLGSVGPTEARSSSVSLMAMRVNGCDEPASAMSPLRYSRRPLTPKKPTPAGVTAQALPRMGMSLVEAMLTSLHVTPPSAVTMISVRPTVALTWMKPHSAMPCSGLAGLNAKRDTTVLMVSGTVAFSHVAPWSSV